MINEENIKRDLILLAGKYVVNNEAIVLDKRKEILASFFEILINLHTSEFSIDKAYNRIKDIQETKPNELRRSTNINLTFFDAIIVFKMLQNEYDEIALEKRFGISKIQIEHINNEIQSFIQLLDEHGINIDQDMVELFNSLEKDGIQNDLKFEGYNDEIENVLNIFYKYITSKSSKELKSNILNLANINIQEYQLQLFCFIEELYFQGNKDKRLALPKEIIVQISIELLQKYQEEFNTQILEYMDKFKNDEIAPFIYIIKDNFYYFLLCIGYFYSKNDLKYIYKLYHRALEKYADYYNSPFEKFTNKSLYKGYINWCKEEDIEPLIKLSFRSVQVSAKKTVKQTESLVGKLQFKRKCVYNISKESEYEQRKYVVPFYRRLYEELKRNSIISPNTDEADFLFIFGHRISAPKRVFKKIQILKPADTAQQQYTGKSLIIQLLLLIGYNIDEIRGNGEYFKDKPTKKKDLILKNCFSPEFTPQDFQFKNNQISFNETICKIVKKAYIEKTNEEILDEEYIAKLDNYIKNKVRVDISKINK